MISTKKWTFPLVILLILQILTEALTVGIILQLNMLPTKYVLVLIALMTTLVLFEALLLFVKVRGNVSVARRIIAALLSLLIIAGCAWVTKPVSEVIEVVQGVTGGNIKTSVRFMYVLVQKNDPAQKLADTKWYSFGVIEPNPDQERVQKARELIEDELHTQIGITGYAESANLVNALLKGEMNAVIINGASLALLMEEEEFQALDDKARILHSFSFNLLDGKEEEPEYEDEQGLPKPPPVVIDPEKNVTNTPFVIYISGSDTRSSMLPDVSLSDVNILMIVNPVDKQVLLINTPRDYYIANPASGSGKLDKLTHCGTYGVGNSMEALSDLYGMDISYYGRINFKGFKTLVDAVGGVTVYSDQSFTARETYIKKGENYLNGSQALDFARERYHVSGGDNTRGKNQMKVIKAVIEKMTSGTTLLSNYSAILSSLEGMFDTNMQSKEINMLVKMQLDDMASWEIFSLAVTGTGGSEMTYTGYGVYRYVMYPDMESVDHASALIDKMLAGEKLTKEEIPIPQ